MARHVSALRGRSAYSTRLATVVLILSALVFLSLPTGLTLLDGLHSRASVPLSAQKNLEECRAIDTKPGPLPAFFQREVSDRFVPGTKPVWIRNATIWTGRVQGLEVISGDLLLSGGIIRAVGFVPSELRSAYKDVEELDAHGAWVSPGCVCLRLVASSTAVEAS